MLNASHRLHPRIALLGPPKSDQAECLMVPVRIHAQYSHDMWLKSLKDLAGYHKLTFREISAGRDSDLRDAQQM